MRALLNLLLKTLLRRSKTSEIKTTSKCYCQINNSWLKALKDRSHTAAGELVGLAEQAKADGAAQRKGL